MYSTTTNQTTQPAPKICAGCEEEFIPSPRTGERQKYCTEQCRNKFRLRLASYHYICEYCTEPYSTEHKERDRFCSRPCAFAHKSANKKTPKPTREKKTIHCKQCGGVFQQQKSEGYCCDECRKAKNRDRVLDYAKTNHEPQTIVCKECGEPFVPGYGNKRRGYCGDSCAKRAANRESGGTLNQRARRSLRKRHGQLTPDIYEPINPENVYIRDGWTCQLCGEPIVRDAEIRTYYSASIDHVVPLALGGKHKYDNVQAAHFGCNWKKGATLP